MPEPLHTDDGSEIRHADRRDGMLFRFTTSSARPTARVRCLSCDWEATGQDVRATFGQADTHVCPRETTRA